MREGKSEINTREARGLAMRTSRHWSTGAFHRLACFLVLLFGAMVLLGGCLPKDPAFNVPLAELQQDAENSARLSFLLNLKDDLGPATRLEVAGIEVLGDGLALPITKGPAILDSAAIGTGQLFLGGIPVPPGRYHSLRLSITKGEVRKAGGDYEVLAPIPFAVEVDFSTALNLEPGDSRSLLISWDVQNSVQPGNVLSPALTAAPPLRQLPVDLIFVSCPEINTVFVVRADKNWVVDSFGLPGRPTYLAVDPDSSRQRLYILASRHRTVKVVDLSSFRIVDIFPVPLDDEPSFMTISPDGEGAFLLDEQSGYVSRVDLTTGRNVARVLVGFRPQYAVYLKAQNLLAVSLGLSQKVLLLDPVSLQVMGTITTGSTPQGLLVSEDQLYVAEYGDNTVSIFDLVNRRSQGRLEVGFGPSRLRETDTLVYVSNYQDGSLSVLAPGQLGVIQEIRGLGRPQELIFDDFYRRLYVADEEAAGLGIVDTNSNLLLGHIFLGAKPFGLAVIQ